MNGVTPTVSVVVPVFNARRFLEQTVRSVREQSFADWELILADDASTDGSAALAEELAATDPRIRLLRNEKNLGVSETRNRGIRAARGEWVALLDSDDFWAPDKLEKQLARACESGAETIYCSYDMTDESGAPFGKSFIVPETTDLEGMLACSVVSCSTAMIRRELLLDHPFREGYAHEDLVLWLELLRAGCRAAGCREVLAYYRQTEGSRSGNKLKAAAGRWRVFRDYMHLPFFRSAALFLRYAAAAVRKYKRS